MKSPLEKQTIGLAGEYRVASELIRRGHMASITYGNAKGTDVIVFNPKTRRGLVVEVKTSLLKMSKRTGQPKKVNFVTGYFQKYWDAKTQRPDVWVLVLMPNAADIKGAVRFFILDDKDIQKVQSKVNKKSVNEKYRSKPAGVDNVPLEMVMEFEDRWDAVEKLVHSSPRSAA